MSCWTHATAENFYVLSCCGEENESYQRLWKHDAAATHMKMVQIGEIHVNKHSKAFSSAFLPNASSVRKRRRIKYRLFVYDLASLKWYLSCVSFVSFVSLSASPILFIFVFTHHISHTKEFFELIYVSREIERFRRKSFVHLLLSCPTTTSIFLFTKCWIGLCVFT